jgi:sugar phosphate isomerase/epimerase
MLERPPLALSLAGLTRHAGALWSAGARAAIEWAAQAGFRHVQLDAAAPRARARDLDRSGRRDLAAFLRRSQLLFSGLDLWIPPEHFIDAGRSDRAMDAAFAALELAAEVAALVAGSPPSVLSVTLPESLPDEAHRALVSRAEATGVRIADHTLAALSQPRGDASSPLTVGIDPAAVLLAGQDPALAVSRAGALLASARLSDATVIARTPPGHGGRLDQLAYLVALSTVGYTRPLVLDLRGIPEQAAAAAAVSSGWAAPMP